jgi:hypothetical protein
MRCDDGKVVVPRSLIAIACHRESDVGAQPPSQHAASVKTDDPGKTLPVCRAMLSSVMHEHDKLRDPSTA